ncbi:MAG: UDP-3-O-(3-hydroxymyristoyl)glucosamine N-acyltransferase [Candidatus Omnitrophota bacterium]
MKMKFTLGEIADLIGGELVGDSTILITGISGIKEAHEGDITFLANPKYQRLMTTTKASAVITSKDVSDRKRALIRTDNPSLAFSKVIEIVSTNHLGCPKGIHPTAIISKSAVLGENVALGPYVVIEDGVKIGGNTVVYSGCYIGHHTEIKEGCLIYPNVTIRERVQIGDKVIIHSGTVIGSDGFGFATVKGIQKKIPQIGTVLIEDYVEIGANVTIDRARFDKTVIGKGTKIDNLVQIAHNVIIGPNCIIVAQAGISGSTTLGKGVIIAGQGGVVGHISIGDGAVIAAQAGVTKSILPNTKVSGYPAKPHSVAKRVNACLQRLPQAYVKIKELEEKIIELEKKLNKDG